MLLLVMFGTLFVGAAGSSATTLTDTNAGFSSVSCDGYGVQIVEFRTGRFATVKASSCGYGPGNWALLWVTGPDGEQMVNGAGKETDEFGNVWLVPNVNYPAGTEYTVQVSVGAWPNESWSQPVTLHN